MFVRVDDVEEYMQHSYRYVICILPSCLKWITVTLIIVDWQLNVNSQCNLEIQGAHTVFGCLSTGVLNRSRKKYYLCEAYMYWSLGLIFTALLPTFQIRGCTAKKGSQKSLKNDLARG